MKSKKLLLYSQENNKVSEYTIHNFTIFAVVIVALSVVIYLTAIFSEAYISEKKNYEIEKLEAKNKALTDEIQSIDQKIANLNEILYQIQNVDDKLRLETNIPRIDNDVKNLGVGGTEVDFYLNENLDDEEKNIIVDKKIDLEDLERKFEFELNSFKNIFSIMKLKEDSLKYLPTILPIPKDVYRVTSSYGKRLHPILGREKNHPGVDMGCDEGTPIYATADGIIDYAGLNGGYGKYVKIGHRSYVKKYNYETIYAHMSKIFVKKGQNVKRGDIIGEVGSTGLSTAPHLHYEVRFNRKTLKPNDYYFVNID